MGSPMRRPVRSSIACFAMVFERCVRSILNERYSAVFDAGFKPISGANDDSFPVPFGNSRL